MKIINELLVKYKNSEDSRECAYIAATIYKGKISDLLPLLKEVDYIELKGSYYVFSDSAFVPSTEMGVIDVLYIYVDSLDE